MDDSPTRRTGERDDLAYLAAPLARFEDSLHDLTNALTAARSYSELLLRRAEAGKATPESVALLRALTEEHARVTAIVRDVRAHARQEFTEFVVRASHEVSEPARSAETLLEIVAAEGAESLDEDVKRALALAAANVGRIKQMMRGLREYRVATDPAERHAVDVDAVLDAVTESDLATLIRDRGAIVAREAGPLPTAGGSAELVRGVLRTLVANAIEHNPALRPRVRVGGGATAEGGREYWVRDDGPGIEPEWRERVFRVFTRGPRTLRDSPSPGLGLTLARRAVDAMGGRIWIEAAPGGGTIVRFTAPAPPPHRDARAPPPRA